MALATMFPAPVSVVESQTREVIVIPTHPRVAELERLGDQIAELCAHLDAATARLLDLIREFDERAGWNAGFRSCAEWLAWRVGMRRTCMCCSTVCPSSMAKSTRSDRHRWSLARCCRISPPARLWTLWWELGRTVSSSTIPPDSRL